MAGCRAGEKAPTLRLRPLAPRASPKEGDRSGDQVVHTAPDNRRGTQVGMIDPADVLVDVIAESSGGRLFEEFSND